MGSANDPGHMDSEVIHSPQDPFTTVEDYAPSKQLAEAPENDQDLSFILDADWPPEALATERLAPAVSELDGAFNFNPDISVNENDLNDLFATLPRDPSPNRESHVLSDAFVSYFIGSTGEQDPNLLQRYRFSQYNELWFKKLATRTTGDGLIPAHWMLALPYGQVELDSVSVNGSLSTVDERVSLEALVPPNVGDRLIKLFMKFISPCFPIFCERQLPETQNSPTYLLAAIYLIADRFFSHDDYLCIQVVYDRDMQKKLFEIAWKSFSDNMHKTSIDLIQAAIVLLLTPLLDPLNPEVSFRWSLMGTLVSMSETMGLHLDPKDWNIPSYQIKLRRRLSGVIYALDTWFALSLGRPTRISSDNWMIENLEELDFNDPESQPKAFSFALEFSKLTNIVKLVLKQLFTIKATLALTTDFLQVLNITRPLLTELSAWQNSLPKEAQRKLNRAPPIDTPHYGGPLQLAYFATRSSIIRALLRTFENPNLESSLHETEVDEFLQARQKCREAAISCTLAMVDFISTLNGLDFEQFWSAWCSSIFATLPHMAMLLVATSRQLDEAGRCKFVLNKMRRVLRTQSRSFDTLKLASLRLDAHFWRGIDNTLIMAPQLGCSFDELIEVPWSAQPD